MALNAKQLEIIDVVADILSNEGFQSLTTKKIADKMGFVESALYRHFKNKDDLITLMLQHIIETTEERLQTIISDSTPADEKLRTFGKLQFSYLAKNKHCIILMGSEDLLAGNKAIHQQLFNMMQTIQKYLTLIFQEGQQTNLFHPNISTENLTHITMGTLRLQMLKWKISNFSFDIESKMNELIENLLILFKNER